MKNHSRYLLNFVRVLVLFIGMFFFHVGCSMGEEISKAMNSWVGSHYSDMMLKWGPPTYSTSDGRGGQILVYRYNRNGWATPGKAWKDQWGNVYYTAPQNYDYVAERMFYVDDKGIIYSWRWQGL
jgi:hypothetical protein